MIVYIAGPITGRPGYNRNHFETASIELMQKGHVVLNPSSLPEGLPEKAYMPICMAMLEQADAIYLLKGWTDSLGARTEHLYALRQNKKIIEEEWGWLHQQ